MSLSMALPELTKKELGLPFLSPVLIDLPQNQLWINQLIRRHYVFHISSPQRERRKNHHDSSSQAYVRSELACLSPAHPQPHLHTPGVSKWQGKMKWVPPQPHEPSLYSSTIIQPKEKS